jgi:hypothetical protein
VFTSRFWEKIVVTGMETETVTTGNTGEGK